ncbi:MAG: PhoH family protein, partial [Clostridia bacterium]|nr:PhoH family protein [Clostridia bacterium]
MQKLIRFTSPDTISKIFGSYDVNVRLMEKRLGIDISSRSDSEGDGVLLDGDAAGVALGEAAFRHLSKMAEYNDDLIESQVSYILDMLEDGRESELMSYGEDCICITTRGKPIKAKTVGQKQYVDAIKKNTIVLGVGPAGTGKTFLAVAMAVKALRDKQVNRIILTRPAVEAGEKLGFLPGDLQNKIDPYLRPLY